MSDIGHISILHRVVEVSTVDAVKRHWSYAQSVTEPITKFDSYSKGWDRLSDAIFPENSSIGHRFKKLTGLCTGVAWCQSVDDLLFEVDRPIRNDLERLERDAQTVFDRTKRYLQAHRSNQKDDQELLESVGSLLWVIRSNSAHGRKTPSGAIGPTNRDEQICGLGAKVMEDLYKFVFPSW